MVKVFRRKKVYPGLLVISKMECFATIVYNFKLLIIVATRCILDVYGSPGFACLCQVFAGKYGINI